MAQEIILTSGYLTLGERFEGCHLQAYFDCAGLLTFGIGHLVKAHEISTYLGKLTLKEAKVLWDTNKAEFYKRVPKFSLQYVHDLKRKDFAIATREVENRLVKWGLSQVLVPSGCLDVLVDLAFNCGPGSLDGGIAECMRKKDFTGAILFAPQYCKARDPKDKSPKPKSVPVTGLTFRRYSVVWYGLTGEVWRIGAEGSPDRDWAEVDVFLHKLTDLLKKEGRTNPLPYPNNRREAQKY